MSKIMTYPQKMDFVNKVLGHGCHDCLYTNTTCDNKENVDGKWPMCFMWRFESPYQDVDYYIRKMKKDGTLKYDGAEWKL